MHPGSPTRWIITIAKLGSLPHAETSMDSSSTFKGPVLPLALFAFLLPNSRVRRQSPYSILPFRLQLCSSHGHRHARGHEGILFRSEVPNPVYRAITQFRSEVEIFSRLGSARDNPLPVTDCSPESECSARPRTHTLSNLMQRSLKQMSGKIL